MNEFHVVIPLKPRIHKILAMIPRGKFQPYTLDLVTFSFPSVALRKVDNTLLNLSAMIVDAPPSRMVSLMNCA